MQINNINSSFLKPLVIGLALGAQASKSQPLSYPKEVELFTCVGSNIYLNYELGENFNIDVKDIFTNRSLSRELTYVVG